MTRSQSLFQFKLQGPWRFTGDLIDAEFEMDFLGTSIKILFPTQTSNIFGMPRLGRPKALREIWTNDNSDNRHLEEPGEPLYFHTDPPLIHHFELYEFFVMPEKSFQNDQKAFEWAKEALPNLDQQLRDWIETSTKQIASYNARAYQNPEFGGNVKFWNLSQDAEVKPISHLYSTIVRDASDEIWGRPVSKEDFQAMLTRVSIRETPKIWQLLLRDARTDFAILNFRKAVLQAGLAAESVLLAFLAERELEFQKPKKKLEEMTLGDLRNAAVDNKIISEEQFQKCFVETRNKAAHKVVPISEIEAIEFLSVVEKLIDSSSW